MKHGGDLGEAMRRYGGAPDDWLDLSTGINPWPWPVPAALPMSVWHSLPGAGAQAALIAAARTAYRVPSGIGIVPAPGTQALIQWLPRLAACGSVAIVSPTYSEHARAWRQAGHPIMEIGSLDDLPPTAGHAVIVNPNNPDGRIADHGTLRAAAARLRVGGGWLVIDESFADFDPDVGAAELCADLPVVILRSFGKFHGLAGLRLGFAIAAETIAASIAEALGPWAVSGPALAIGEAALRDLAWAAATRARLRAQADILDRLLEAAHCNLVGGTPLYRLVRHPAAATMHETLARRRIWCRRFDLAADLLRFGLPPDAAEFDRLAAALAEH